MRHLTWLTLLVLTLLPAVPATASVRLRAPVGVTVHAGDRIELRWEGLDPSVREVEFELSLDGGRWVRISPELEALDGRWTWRVPDLDAADARIRLRSGGFLREEVAAVGPRFRIAGKRESVSGEFLGEWWPAFDHEPRQHRPIGLHAGTNPVLAAASRPDPADVPGATALAAPPLAADAAVSTEVPSPASRHHARSARPAFVPLRN